MPHRSRTLTSPKKQGRNPFENPAMPPTSADFQSSLQSALNAGDIDQALALWRRHAEATPDPATLLAHASFLQALYHFREAVAVLDALLAHPDTTPDQLLPAAKLFFQTGRHARAARFTEAALARDPDNPDTAVLHASCLERSGAAGEARALLARTLEAHPAHARAARLAAHILRNKGELDTARDHLAEHLAAHPSPEDWRLRYELAAVLDRLGEYAEAIRNLSLAKHQIRAQSRPHHPRWRAMTERQWDLTTSLDPARLAAWSRPATPPTPALRLCLMGGFPRSGTTLLEQIISTHPDCIGTDETGILATQFRDPLVLAAPSAAAALADLDDLKPEILSAGRAEYLRCTEEYIGESVGGRILLEKDPLITANLPVPLRLFPEAKILMPLRDPRDIVISYFFTIVPLAPNSVASANFGDSCRYYSEVMRHWLFLRDELDPAGWMESRYEDLLADPGKQTHRLADFLGIDWSPAMLAHHRRPDAKSVSTPTYDDVSKPLYTRAKGRWKNYGRWLEPHLHHLEPFLEAFGYR